MHELMGVLRCLAKAGATLSDPADDIRGHQVRDSAGEEIGVVEDLLIDDFEQRVRLLRASCGSSPASEKSILIPVDAVTRITDREVYINRSRYHVGNLPPYHSDSADQHYYELVYAYYGYYPFWVPGYVYPTYPAYPDP